MVPRHQTLCIFLIYRLFHGTCMEYSLDTLNSDLKIYSHLFFIVQSGMQGVGQSDQNLEKKKKMID